MKKIVLWGRAALLAAATAQAALLTRDLGQGISPQDMVGALLGGRRVCVQRSMIPVATNASGIFCGGDGNYRIQNRNSPHEW